MVPGTSIAAARRVDCADLRALFSRTARLARSFYRRTADGDEFLALGVALRAPDAGSCAATSSLPEQFRALREAVLGTGAHAAEPDALDSLRLLGWSAFDPDYSRDADSTWSAFSRRELYLPEVLLRRSAGRTEATIFAPNSDADDVWRRWSRVIDAATSASPREQSCGNPPAKSTENLWLDRDAFRQGVQRVSEDKVAPKVVLARRTMLKMEAPIDLGDAMEILEESYPTCTHFAISAPENPEYPIFFGATPERLARVENGEVRTMALAGTAGIGSAENLLASAKDREEHRFVVDMIVDALRAICSEVTADAPPKIKRLTNVAHLLTEISGALRPDVGLAEVVDALHPTPAVCGTPRGLARKLIAEFEGFDRGLYAGTFGWMDLRGQGEFDVALRCGLLGEARALLFAGAGITGESDVDLEWAETRAKFEPLLHALGAEAQS